MKRSHLMLLALFACRARHERARRTTAELLAASYHQNVVGLRAVRFPPLPTSARAARRSARAIAIEGDSEHSTAPPESKRLHTACPK